MELIVETEITCPHCGESFPLEIDTSQPEQSLIEDCTVCCRPISLTIRCRPGVIVDLEIVDV
jgi:Cysteine-rich CPXCG